MPVHVVYNVCACLCLHLRYWDAWQGKLGRGVESTSLCPLVTALEHIEVMHAAKRTLDCSTFVLLTHFAKMVEACLEGGSIHHYVAPVYHPLLSAPPH